MTNSIFTKSLFAAAAVAVSVVGFTASANAQSHVTRSAVVHFDDLDLTSADGKSTLDARLQGAVRQVCGGYDSRSLTDRIDHRNCTSEAQLSAKRGTVTILAAAAAGQPFETSIAVGGN